MENRVPQKVVLSSKMTLSLINLDPVDSSKSRTIDDEVEIDEMEEIEIDDEYEDDDDIEEIEELDDDDDHANGKIPNGISKK